MVTLFLSQTNQPWWSITGAMTNRLLTIEVSPFYLKTDAIGLSTSLPFTTALGSSTHLLSVLGIVTFMASSIRPTAWWRPLTLTVSVCAVIELYLSFLLMHLAAEAALLGAYGIVPPLYGNSYLPVSILGLDLKNYTRPLVTASFGLPFYIGFFGLGLIGSGFVIKGMRERRRRIKQKGVQAIFTS
jgi:hypothetical protein